MAPEELKVLPEEEVDLKAKLGKVPLEEQPWLDEVEKTPQPEDPEAEKSWSRQNGEKIGHPHGAKTAAENMIYQEMCHAEAPHVEPKQGQKGRQKEGQHKKVEEDLHPDGAGAPHKVGKDHFQRDAPQEGTQLERDLIPKESCNMMNKNPIPHKLESAPKRRKDKHGLDLVHQRGQCVRDQTHQDQGGREAGDPPLPWPMQRSHHEWPEAWTEGCH